MLFAIVVNEALALFYATIARKQGSWKEYKEVRKKIKAENKGLYNRINFRTRFFWSHLVPPFLKPFVVKTGYMIVKKKTGWY